MMTRRSMGWLAVIAGVGFAAGSFSSCGGVADEGDVVVADDAAAETDGAGEADGHPDVAADADVDASEDVPPDVDAEPEGVDGADVAEDALPDVDAEETVEAETVETTEVADVAEAVEAETVEAVEATDATEVVDVGDVADVGGCRTTEDCMSGLTCCEGRCANLFNDPANCSECGAACPETRPFCSGGSCESIPCEGGPTCVGEQFCCGMTCCRPGQVCCNVDGPGPTGGPGCYDSFCPGGCPLCG